MMTALDDDLTSAEHLPTANAQALAYSEEEPETEPEPAKPTPKPKPKVVRPEPEPKVVEHTWPHTFGIAAILFVCLFLTAWMVGIAGSLMMPHDEPPITSEQINGPTKPTTTVTAVAPPSPPAVTVTVTPPPPPAPITTTTRRPAIDPDTQYLSELGWNPAHPAAVIRQGHRACELLARNPNRSMVTTDLLNEEAAAGAALNGALDYDTEWSRTNDTVRAAADAYCPELGR